MRSGSYELEDKYAVDGGRIFVSGLAALARVMMLQHQRDAANGLNTGGFVTGYRGSPLAGFDIELNRARRFLEKENIHFQPALNEELAATAVWGTQQANLWPGSTVDGVFSMWYGKGPGVDRAMDAIKHGNMAGSSPHGGVLLVVGDDHACQSSTLPHQSDQVLQAAMVPILNPSWVQDYVEFGLYGFALSRFSGCWVALKAIAETVESSASLSIRSERPAIVIPTDYVPPAGGLHIRWPDPPLEQERRLHGPKMTAVASFANANGIDRLVVDGQHARLGIITTGKAYLDVRQALEDLGIDDSAAAALGLRVYKVGLSWPLEETGARRFAEGLDDILVVEEKRAFVEAQLAGILINASRRPMIVGKRDEHGAPLIPSEGELTPAVVARAIVSRLARMHADGRDIRHRLAMLNAREQAPKRAVTMLERTPFFCAGCPHNTSTRLPEGSRALGGIGCHGMATFVPQMRTETVSQMGGEGATWIGQAQFRQERHVFQNLGDGTYAHSGSLAIRAAAAAGVNITYKILYNDAVAMTGGQPVEGGISVGRIAQQVAAEGAKRVVVVTDDVDKYRGDMPAGVSTRPRADLDAVQRELREIAGVTVLIYDQACAAEKRRRRKRAKATDTPTRVFINQAVCEGCGDCSRESNCIAIVPVETEFGRKRAIDQSSCNTDYSCLNGFCPSFVTVQGATVQAEPAMPPLDQERMARLPEPAGRELGGTYNVLVTGIGGTGVLTVGAVLGMAAHLDNKACSVLSLTGMAQKNGTVASHIRLASHEGDLKALRIPAGSADVVIGCDLVATAGRASLSAMSERTRVIVNTHAQPTAAFVRSPDIDFNTAGMRTAIRDAAGIAAIEQIDATQLATNLIGDSIAANLFMLGYAYQKGLIPVSSGAIARAIEVNGVAVDTSKSAFSWGRLAAHDWAAVARHAGIGAESVADPAAADIHDVIQRRMQFLSRYQSASYADRYSVWLDEVRRAESAVAPQSHELTRAVADNLFRVMAYKDEYEVARLHVDPEFAAQLRRQFGGNVKLNFHLASPLFASRDPATGHRRKRTFGPWVVPVFKLLAILRALRGTPFDVFGYAAERRTERALIADYEATLRDILSRLSSQTHLAAIDLARFPEQVRGFGHVKQRNLTAALERKHELRSAFHRCARAGAADAGGTSAPALSSGVARGEVHSSGAATRGGSA